jgi:hypothetical protein
MTRCAVLQAKPGFGDVIWHLPFVRAIAATLPGGKVTFLAPPRSGAAELLAAEPSVVEVLYFEHHGSELRRGINLIRLVALLRRKRFDAIWILDRTLRPAIAAVLAGVPERIGVGLGRQRLFITNSGIDRIHFHDHPIDWLRALMAAMNVPLATVQPELRVPGDTLAKVDAKFGSCAWPCCSITPSIRPFRRAGFRTDEHRRGHGNRGVRPIRHDASFQQFEVHPSDSARRRAGTGRNVANSSRSGTRNDRTVSGRLGAIMPSSASLDHRLGNRRNVILIGWPVPIATCRSKRKRNCWPTSAPSLSDGVRDSVRAG